MTNIHKVCTAIKCHQCTTRPINGSLKKLGSLRCVGLHPGRKGRHLQNHRLRHAHGLYEVQAKRSRRAGWSRWHWGKNLLRNHKTTLTNNILFFRMVSASPNCWASMRNNCIRLCWSPRLRSVTNSSPRVVTSTRSSTPSVPCPRPCSTGCSSGWSRNVTRLWTPSRRDSTSSVYWILPVSKSST